MKRGPTGRYEVATVGGETVRAFVPHPLPPEPGLALGGPIQPLLERALLAVGRLDSVSTLLPGTGLFLYSMSGRKPSSRRQPEPGKTKISIRLDNIVLDYIPRVVDKAGGGNYQTLINEALLEHVHRRSTVDVVRQVVRQEMASYVVRRRKR